MNHEPVRLDPQRIGRTLDDIAEIGNRFAGTPGEAACCDYLLGRFAGARRRRAAARSRSRTWGSSVPARAAGSRATGRLELESHPLQYTSRTPATGEAVYLGAAGEEDFARIDRAGVELAGRIVLGPRDLPVRPVRRAGSAERSPGSCTSARRPRPIVGNFTGALYPPPLQPPWTGRPQPYTGVTIGDAAGRALLSAMTCGEPVSDQPLAPGRIRRGAWRRTSWRRSRAPATARARDRVRPLRQPGRGPVRLRQRHRPRQPARVRPRAARPRSAPADRADRLGVRGDRRVGRDRVRTRARREIGDAAAMVNLDGLASAYPAAARDLVGRRGDGPAGRGDRARAGLVPRPGRCTSAARSRSRAVRRRRRARPA